MELELKEGNRDFETSDNSFIDILEFMKLKNDTIKRRSLDLFKELSENQKVIEKEFLGKKQNYHCRKLPRELWNFSITGLTPPPIWPKFWKILITL